MPISLYDSNAKEGKPAKPETSVVTGTVVNNCDLMMQGKVLVRIPSLDQEVWARMAAPGAGSGAGMFYAPRADDEVLVALNGNDPVDAFIIGGLWSTQDSPPVSTPTDVISKRIIKTGLKAGLGHEVEFDDGPGQSVTITTTTKQKIALDPKKIEISTTGGKVKITLDMTTQAITIEALNSITLSAKASLKLEAGTIEINGKAMTKITGKPVMIN